MVAMTDNHPPNLRDADAPPASTRIVEAVARAEGDDPLELDRPLHVAVDTDALDTLCGEDTSVTSVTFTYHGYVVTVEGDGEVTVTESTT